MWSLTGSALIDILQAIQAISVIVGIIAFYIEYRRSIRERGYHTYIETKTSLVDLEKLFIEHPEMQRLWEYDDKYKELSIERRKLYHYCSMLQEIFEVVFIASPHDRGWMAKEEWEGWEEFIKDLAKNSEEFRLAWILSRDMYAGKYRSYMDNIIKAATEKN